MFWIMGQWYYHGGDIEVEMLEYELGLRAAFDLLHHDITMFTFWDSFE